MYFGWFLYPEAVCYEFEGMKMCDAMFFVSIPTIKYVLNDYVHSHQSCKIYFLQIFRIIMLHPTEATDQGILLCITEGVITLEVCLKYSQNLR